MVRPVKPALSMISRLARLGPPYFAAVARPHLTRAYQPRARRCAGEHHSGTGSSAWPARSHSAQRIIAHAFRLRTRTAGNLLQNAGHPEVALRGAMVGMALTKFADRPRAKNRDPNCRDSGKLRRGKLVDGHYSAPPASFSKPPGITPTDSVLGGWTAIHYYEK